MLLDFFQLREQPFSVAPHPSYLYSNRARSEAMDSLAHAAASGSGVLALLGDPGVGKTTLLNQFLATLRPSVRPILLSHTHFSVDEFLEYLLFELGAAAQGEDLAALRSKLDETLSSEIHSGRTYVLIVDNAETLNASLLETICSFSDSESPIAVILAGRPQLRERLHHSPSPLSFAARFLEPLSGAETASYIQHRLRVAGQLGPGLFDREALALIAERSQGLPRVINQICFRALLEGYAAGSRTLSAEIVEKAAERLDFSTAPQPATQLKPALLPGIAPTSPRPSIRPGRSILSTAFPFPAFYRRAAVTIFATAALVLPYLGAKRVAASLRTETTSSQNRPQTSIAAESAFDIPPSATTPPSSEPAKSATSLAATLSPRPPLNSTPQLESAGGRDSNRETTQRIAADDSAEQIPASGPQLSLARELGLKINRIAIDPGHGGYDTGTIGPTGLMEKDLCLDVALRLGRMIKENLPGAEVVYTRTDDRHIPLEERTAIANDAQADLFISIHANSSDVRQIRGVETYYVSLAASPEAREIATRENAVGDSSLHNLPDLIKKITRNENLAESRQLASGIQASLAQRLQLVSRQESNRGVKRAPFIVLTGANMPAVLSEISFVSNPSDEKMLYENDQRQRITEGLYRGILAYLGTMPARGVPERVRAAEASAHVLSVVQPDGLR